jgi:hypothetical protein
MEENVRSPEASEGGHVPGKAEISAFWIRPWQAFDPIVEPIELIEREDGRTEVRVHQLVKSLSGEFLSHSEVRHVYTISGGLIERMDLKEDEANATSGPSSAFAKH